MSTCLISVYQYIQILLTGPSSSAHSPYCHSRHVHFHIETCGLPHSAVQASHGGFCSSQALDVILEKMKASGFDFSQVLALSGAGQVCLQQSPCSPPESGCLSSEDHAEEHMLIW
jgi:hypothetical protein